MIIKVIKKNVRFSIALLLVAMLLVMSSCGKAQGDATTEAQQSAGDETEGYKDNGGKEIIAKLHSLVTAENCSDYDFSEKAMEYLNVIAENYQNRCIGLDGNDNTHEAFIDWLENEIIMCGYTEDQLEEQPFTAEGYEGEVNGKNIILTIPGEDTSHQIIVGAHFDGDGISDNGSGVALLMAAAARFADVTPHYTVKFIFFDGEEEGLFGSIHYVDNMSEEEIASTIYMVNVDAILFGDFCEIYGGLYGDDYDLYSMFVLEEDSFPEVRQTEGYDFAADTAESLGFKVYRTKDLDGYYDKNGKGMDVEENAFFTNPWTKEHPAPANMLAPSPATIPASDHVSFATHGIEIIYFEATNWWAGKEGSEDAYTGYIETYDTSLGEDGMFMNTEYDTMENLKTMFPGRAEEHFKMYSELLSALILVEE